MKAKFLMLLGVVVLGGCFFVNNSISAQTKSYVHTDIEQAVEKAITEEQERKYQEAVSAMDGIYKSIEILTQDEEFIVISLSNQSSYDFNSMMVHAEFVNKKGHPYHVETAFIFNGLKAGENRIEYIEITDPEMVKDLDWINFYTEGF